jgi:hypothetical protein
MTRTFARATSAALGLSFILLHVPAAAKPCPRLCRPEIAACRSSCVTLSRPERRRCRRTCRSTLLTACRATPAPSCAAPAPVARQIVVNGVVLDAAALAVVEQLEAQHGVRVPDGRYWYDAVVGLWGREGEGTSGLIPPGLPLGGSLPADASGGGTGVFVNGRELHPVEVGYLSRCFAVPPGRYALDAQGIASLEGGPPLVDVVAACRAVAVQHGPGGDPWYGSVIGDGNVVGAIFGDTGVTCGPDGGCVF